MNSRPVGMTIISLLLFLNAVMYAVFAVLYVVDTDALAAVLKGMSPGGAGPAPLHLAMGRFLPVYYAAFMVFTAVLGLGAWKCWNWTRLVALALMGINLIVAVPMAFNVIRSGSAAGIARVAVSVLLGLVFVWYLRSTKVRAACRPSAAGPQPQLPNASVHHAR